MNEILLYCLNNLPDDKSSGFLLILRMVLPFCVYVLQSEKDLLLYHGFTTDLNLRLKDHNAGKTNSTSKRRPLKLVYSEFFISKQDAMRRESYFKTTQGKRMLKLILRDTLKKIDYPNR